MHSFQEFVGSIVVLFGGMFEAERARRIECKLNDIRKALGRLPGELDADFVKFALRLSDQSQELDALNASLGVLAALEFAAMTFMVDRIAGDAWLLRAAAVSLALPMLLALFGMIFFDGRESPELNELLEGLRLQRDTALRNSLEAMANSFSFNQRQIAWKTWLLRVSIVLATSMLLVSIAGRVI